MTTIRELRGGVLSEAVRSEFPILANRGRNGSCLAYLDNAATTQKPRAVLDAMTDYYVNANSNVGRGYYGLSMESTARYERARSVVQIAIGAERPCEVVFTHGTTDSMNQLADTIGRRLVG